MCLAKNVVECYHLTNVLWFVISKKSSVYRSDINDVEPVMYNIVQCTSFENKLSECHWTQTAVSLNCISGIVTLYCCK